MLPPRTLVTLGGLLIVVSAIGALFTAVGASAIIVGGPLGLALILSAGWGGGPKPVPREGYGFTGAMELLRRVTVATSAVAAAATVSAATLWWYSTDPAYGGGIGSVTGIDVLLVFLLSLLSVFLAVLTASAIVFIAELESPSSSLSGSEE